MALVEREIDGIVEEVEDTWGDMERMEPDALRIFETIGRICAAFNTVASCFAFIRHQSSRRPAATQPTHQVPGPPALPALLLQAADGTVMAVQAVPLHFAPGVMPHPSPQLPRPVPGLTQTYNVS
jgi:hypothetical protein